MATLRQQLCSRLLSSSRGLLVRTVVTDAHAPVLSFSEQLHQPTEFRAGGKQRTLCILHGLLGSGRNWSSFGRRVGPPLADATGAAQTIYCGTVNERPVLIRLDVTQAMRGASFSWISGTTAARAGAPRKLVVSHFSQKCSWRRSCLPVSTLRAFHLRRGGCWTRL